MLTTAICLEQYMKRDMSSLLHDSIKQEWLAHWKEHLGKPLATPRQVLWAYVEDLDITVAKLNTEMDWDCWDKDNMNGSQQEWLGYGLDQCVGLDHIPPVSIQVCSIDAAQPPATIDTYGPALPPLEPPPVACHKYFPPFSFMDKFMCPTSPTSIIVPIDLYTNQEAESALAQLPQMLSIVDSVTHVVCSPQVCGIQSNGRSSFKFCKSRRQQQPEKWSMAAQMCVSRATLAASWM